jgi:hypothetical protein
MMMRNNVVHCAGHVSVAAESSKMVYLCPPGHTSDDKHAFASPREIRVGPHGRQPKATQLGSCVPCGELQRQLVEIDNFLCAALVEDTEGKMAEAGIRSVNKLTSSKFDRIQINSLNCKSFYYLHS